MTGADTEWQRWVQAAKILAADPRAQVLCPRHGDGYLSVTDVPAKDDPSQVERHLRCPVCGASNIIRNPRGR
ncbi:MAG TPA: hypothetical protein VJT31_14380 [Rugosimonospora sp.]|nr:hypothetical protein [Rugosimonospora sp.]